MAISIRSLSRPVAPKTLVESPSTSPSLSPFSSFSPPVAGEGDDEGEAEGDGELLGEGDGEADGSGLWALVPVTSRVEANNKEVTSNAVFRKYFMCIIFYAIFRIGQSSPKIPK